MATPIRMKKKAMNKIHLGPDGAQVTTVVQASSDAASKGASAQPATLLTPQETTGLPGGTSVKEAPKSDEESTGNTLQGPALEATTAGAVEAMEEPTTELPESPPAPAAGDTTGDPAPPPALGDPAPAAPTMEAAKDPNAQKEATTVAPNTGAGTIVGETESK